MEIRLDRAMVTSSWGSLFLVAKPYNLEMSPSDHSPIFLEPGGNLFVRNKRRFHFENAWLLEPLCFQIVKNNWEEDSVQNIMHKVQQCGESLEMWGKEITCCFSKRIKECKLRLKQL